MFTIAVVQAEPPPLPLVPDPGVYTQVACPISTLFITFSPHLYAATTMRFTVSPSQMWIIRRSGARSVLVQALVVPCRRRDGHARHRGARMCLSTVHLNHKSYSLVVFASLTALRNRQLRFCNLARNCRKPKAHINCRQQPASCHKLHRSWHLVLGGSHFQLRLDQRRPCHKCRI